MSATTSRLPVAHLVSAMAGAGDELWGKERVIAALIHAQAQSKDVVPNLIAFAPCVLGEIVASEGVNVRYLSDRHQTVSIAAFLALCRTLASGEDMLLHTHGYKANILGRLARKSGVRVRGLVSTCHGWIDETSRTRLYNYIDRATASASDVVTVTDSNMLNRFFRRTNGQYIANGVPDREAPSKDQRRAARALFGLPADRLVAGMLGRTDVAKGVAEVVEAARRTINLPIHWVIAGSGPLDDWVTRVHLPNFTFLGYVRESQRYLDAIDVYVQASYSEGLSLALLEAMRAQLAIVATPVGSTTAAVGDGHEAQLVPVRDVNALVAAVRRFTDEPQTRARMAAAARQRFERSFRVQYQHEAFLEIYHSCDRTRL